MTYNEAIKLIGRPVERLNLEARHYIVLDVTNEREDQHNVLLSGGACIPLADFDKMYRAIGVVENAKTN